MNRCQPNLEPIGPMVGCLMVCEELDSLPGTFNAYFPPVNQRHKYYTRLVSRLSYSLPRI